MERILSPQELRIAGRQAVTLGMGAGNSTVRSEFLERADRLFKEAEARAGNLPELDER